ncbi:MAG: hypothetical protein HY289_13320 [Planctomycetes bacterium]|nr:hypothetical protein [Planctomycetota bacterium]
MAELQAAAEIVCPKCGFRMAGKGAVQAKPAAKPAPAKPIVVPPKPAAKPIVAPPPPAAKPIVVRPQPAAKPVAAPPKPPAPTPPLAVPVPAPPPAQITAAAPPLASPVAADESVADGSFFNPEVDAGGGTLVRTGTAKRPFRWVRLLIMLGAIGAAASLVIAAIVGVVWFFIGSDAFRNLDRQDKDGIIHRFRNNKNETEEVYRLVLQPRKEWTVDNVIASRFEPTDRTERGWSVSAWKSETYDFWFAVVVKDYGMHRPRDAEMLRICVEKLEAHFGEEVEMSASTEPGGKFGKVAAQKLTFRGTFNSAKWGGECHMFFNNGIAYWLFLSSNDVGTYLSFAADMPEKTFFILSDRRGWREQPPLTEPFATPDGKISLTVPEKIWTASTDPKSEIPPGIMLLRGRHREKDNRKDALLLVFTLEKKDGLEAALKAAQEHLAEEKKKESTDYEIVLAPEVVAGQKDTGTLTDVGNKRGRMLDLKLLAQKEASVYYLLSVVNEPDGCYVIACSCDWKSRTIWRQEFLDMLRTLRVK